MLEVKIKGMGDEKYIRICPVCKSDNETCNWCEYKPKYPEKHKHKFFYWKTIIKKKWFGLSKTKIKISKCPCGKMFKEAIK